MYDGRAALSCSMTFIPTENYFTADTKRVISSMQSFTKKGFWKKARDISIQRTENSPDLCKFFSNKLYLTPACLPTCCCLATFPLSDVIHSSFAHCCQATARTSSKIHIYIKRLSFSICLSIYKNIFSARIRAA